MLWRPSHRFHVQQGIACRYPGAQGTACLHAHWKPKHRRALLDMLRRLRQSQASDGNDLIYSARKGLCIKLKGTLLTMQRSLQGSAACILQEGGL